MWLSAVRCGIPALVAKQRPLRLDTGCESVSVRQLGRISPNLISHQIFFRISNDASRRNLTSKAKRGGIVTDLALPNLAVSVDAHDAERLVVSSDGDRVLRRFDEVSGAESILNDLVRHQFHQVTRFRCDNKRWSGPTVRSEFCIDRADVFAQYELPWTLDIFAVAPNLSPGGDMQVSDSSVLFNRDIAGLDPDQFARRQLLSISGGLGT